MHRRSGYLHVVLAGALALGLLAGCGGGGSGGDGGGGDPAPADLSAPLFSGLKGGSTAGGPFVRLDWLEAVDDDGAAPSYRVYRSTTSGGQDFGAAPAATSAAGTTSAILPATVGTQAYYVVRAVDGDGNEDLNSVEIGLLPVAPANVAFVSDTGGAGTLGDPTDPFDTIQSGVTAVEGAGGGVVLVDAANGGTDYAEEVDFVAAVSSIALYGSFARFSALPAAPTGGQILATRDLDDAETRIVAPSVPYALDDVVRVENGGSPTHVDGFGLRGDALGVPLTGTVDLNTDNTTLYGSGTSFTTEVEVGDVIQLDPDGPLFARIISSVDNDTQLQLDLGYTGDGGNGLTASILTSAGPALRAIDSRLQLSCCRLYQGASVETGTTGITTSGSTRIVGNRAEGFGPESFVVGGGCELLRFENNHIDGRQRALSALDDVAALRVLAGGTRIHVAHNLIDGRSGGSAKIDIELRESQPASGGLLDVTIEGNEVRNSLGQGIRLRGCQRVGEDGEVRITARYNLFNGTGNSGLELIGFEDGVEDPPAGVDVTIDIHDNEFLNCESELCEIAMGVSANRETSIRFQDNLLAIAQSECLEVDDQAGPTDDTSNGGIFGVDAYRNFHFGGAEDFNVDVGVPYEGRTYFTFVENTVLSPGDPAVELESRERLGTSTVVGGFPNGFACINVFNNDLHGSDDEAINLEDRRDDEDSGQDDSILVCYIGHNLARNGSDGSDGAIELQYRSDNGAFLVERNFTGGGGQDSSEVGIELETEVSALRNYVRIRNNVATLGSGGGFLWDPYGSFAQLINNTSAYAGQTYDNHGFENDVDAVAGDDQTFVLNCISSHSGGGDIDRHGGVSPFYSLIRDEPNPLGYGNLGGEPWYAKDLQALNIFAVGPEAFSDLFTLKSTSPAVDAGHPDPAYNDPDGTRNDMGAYGGPAAGPLGLVSPGAATPLRYVGTFPAVDLFTGAVLPADTQTLWLGFNRPVGPALPAGQIEVLNGGVAVPGTLTVQAGGYVVEFEPTTTLAPNSGTFVDIVIHAALTSTSGEALGQTERHRFSVRPAAPILESEPNDDAAPGVLPADLTAAQSLDVGPASVAFELNGEIASATDIDVYSFTAGAGERIMATILDSRNGGGNDGRIHLDLYDGSGEVVTVGRRDLFNEGNTSNNGDPYLDHVLPAAGTYYLVVSNPDTTAPPQSYVLMGVLD